MAHRKTRRNPLFAGRWFEDEVILLCLRWYFRFKLSYRDLVEMLSERGLIIAHTTILRRSEEHTSELQSRLHLVCRLLLEKTQTMRSPASAAMVMPEPPGSAWPGRGPQRFGLRLPAAPTQRTRPPGSSANAVAAGARLTRT